MTFDSIKKYLFGDSAFSEELFSTIKNEKQTGNKFNKGAGETQLEIEKQSLKRMEAKYGAIVAKHQKLLNANLEGRQKALTNLSIPNVSVVG